MIISYWLFEVHGRYRENGAEDFTSVLDFVSDYEALPLLFHHLKLRSLLSHKPGRPGSAYLVYVDFALSLSLVCQYSPAS